MVTNKKDRATQKSLPRLGEKTEEPFMYYSAGTYESFAHPEKPKDVDKKSAYIIGTGLAGLTAAFTLSVTVR